MPSASATAQNKDTWLVLPFVESVRQVLEKMLRISPTVREPYVTTENSDLHEIRGVISFSGTISGSVTVTFTHQAAAELVEAFAGKRLEITHPHFRDAIGELSNMIAGSAKPHLPGKSDISIPDVLIGKCRLVEGVSDCPYVVIPCSSERGEFAVEVRIKKTPPTPNPA